MVRPAELSQKVTVFTLSLRASYDFPTGNGRLLKTETDSYDSSPSSYSCGLVYRNAGLYLLSQRSGRSVGPTCKCHALIRCHQRRACSSPALSCAAGRSLQRGLASFPRHAQHRPRAPPTPARLAPRLASLPRCGLDLWRLARDRRARHKRVSTYGRYL
jgi:hypothetical protein